MMASVIAAEVDVVRISVGKLTLMAVLTAIALIIFIVEAQIPLPVPVPGAKLGLANTVTLFALFYKGGAAKGRAFPDLSIERGKEPGAPDLSIGRGKMSAAPALTAADAFMILVCRILLGAVFTGRIVAFIYSIAGGVLGFAAQATLRRFVSDRQIWACGAVGAVFHNVGQILAAVVVTGTPAIAAYLPVLIIAGVATGIITGLVAQLTIARITTRV
jgi:heptaprenyl diphosphate synthase